MLERIPTSAKRNGARRDADLYYYYAGFSQGFIERKIAELDLPPSSVVLDPWCGSGTTLAAAQRLGYRSIGCDINPVSIVLTKSRFASREDASAVLERLDKAITELASARRSERQPEVLLWTLRNRLFSNIDDSLWARDGYRRLDARTSLLWTGLFFFARQATHEARSKNPSWRKSAGVQRISLSQLQSCFERLVPILVDFKKTGGDEPPECASARVELLDNETESISPASISDAVITSPPYLTRLDYGIATGLEWRLLKGDPQADLTGWRSSFTGSVLTFRVPTSKFPLPRSVADVLHAIHRHPSKAAQTYYFRFFRNYFVGIQNAIGTISTACKIGGRGIFVVQNSQFKEIDIRLTELFTDMLSERGWSIEKVEPFAIAPTFYKINSRRWAVDSVVRHENLIWAKRSN